MMNNIDPNLCILRGIDQGEGRNKNHVKNFILDIKSMYLEI